MPSTAYSLGLLLALASAMVTQGCGECQSSCSGTADRPVTLQGDEWLTHTAPGDPPSVAEGCQATATHDPLVQELLRRMEKSIKCGKAPNPSILLAMNLAGATDGHVHSRLLQEIKENAVERAQTDMTSGEVALYILALLSSCQDPRCVHAMGKTINLIPILKQKMSEEISKKEITWYRQSLDILALCLVKEYDNQDAVGAVATELLNTNSSLSVDTQAMAVLALVCAYNHTDKQDLVHDALKAVTNNFLDEQKSGHGMIGNIYSMALALQALQTSSEFYAPRQWDRAQAFSVVYAHDYQQPMAIAQVLPALVGRSYLDAGRWGHNVPEPMAAPVSMCQVPSLPLSPPTAPITVQFSITNTLKNYFHYSTSVCVPRNSTLLHVMKVAMKEKPDIFCFKTKPTCWGPFVTSIHRLAGNDTERTYWQFFSCWSPLQEGGHQGGRGAQGAALGGLHVPASLLPLLQGLAPTSQKTGSTSRLFSAPTDATKTPWTHPRNNKVPFQHVSVCFVSLGENAAHIPLVFLPAEFHELSSSPSLSQHRTQAQPHPNSMESIPPGHQQSLSPAAMGLFLQPHSWASVQPIVIPTQALMALITCNYL
ncbi:cobalamin binding intrinsic factor-like [Prinia subflava]|uniref:cobalamin binding intrinsic factor-like n=1 Tax=Prinia subflava TaxID=208062 RepID=UPI002FE32DE0